MVLDDGGSLRAWEPEAGPAHYQNKALTWDREQAFFEGPAMAGRTSWVVLGDKPYDVTAVGGAPTSACEATLAVGFFDHTVPLEAQRYTLADYAAVYDVVLPANHACGLSPVAEIVLGHAR
jgi:hypothetical protein